MAPPSNLPLFAQLRRVLVGWLELFDLPNVSEASELGAKLEALPPEVFMHCLEQGKVDLDDWLAATLSRGGPNAVHAVLAWCLDHGDTIWSLNVDELIEGVPVPGESLADAVARRRGLTAALEMPPSARPTVRSSVRRLGGDGRIASTSPLGSAAPQSGARLFKPHGTVSTKTFIFRTDQVLRPLPPAWADRLGSDFSGAEVVVIGYAGADIDLRACLASALERAESITWFAYSAAEWERAQRYLPVLKSHPRVTPVIDKLPGFARPNPSRDFVAWSREERVDGYVTDQQRGRVDEDPRPECDPPRGRPGCAGALLLERLKERDAAIAAFRREMLRPGWRHRRALALARYAKLQWYAGAPAFAPIRFLDRSRFGPVTFAMLAGRVRRAHIMWLSSELGDQEAAQTLAASASEGDPATWIVRAKAWRYQGSCLRALEASRRGAELAGNRAVRWDEAAHARFEEVFSLIWLGRWDEARAQLVLLYEGYDGQAAARWLGWSRYLRAGLLILGGGAADAVEAEKELEQAKGYFAADDDGGRRAASCDVLLIGARRRAGGPISSLPDVPGGATPALAYLQWAAEIEAAEVARATGDLSGALEAYKSLARLVHRPMLSAMALIGMAEVQFALKLDPRRAIEDGAFRARQHGFRHLELETLITSARAGVLGRDDAKQALRSFQELLRSQAGEREAQLADPSSPHPLFSLW